MKQRRLFGDVTPQSIATLLRARRRKDWKRRHPEAKRAEKRGYARRHPEVARRWKAKCAARRAVDEDYRLAYRVGRVVYRYGLTPERARELLVLKVCEACGGAFEEGVLLLRRHIDHDHVTGAVRGAIHQRCNVAIGLLGESVDLAERIARYLRQRCQLKGEE